MYENDWHFPSFDIAADTMVLCEKCFLPFNNRLSVTHSFALTFAYTQSFSEFQGVWMVNIFRLQTRYDRNFIFLAICFRRWKASSLFQLSASDGRTETRLCDLLSLQKYLINETQLKLLIHKAAAFPQIMVPFNPWPKSPVVKVIHSQSWSGFLADHSQGQRSRSKCQKLLNYFERFWYPDQAPAIFDR